MKVKKTFSEFFFAAPRKIMVELLLLEIFCGQFVVFEKFWWYICCFWNFLVVHLLLLEKFGGTFVVLKIFVVNLLFWKLIFFRSSRFRWFGHLALFHPDAFFFKKFEFFFVLYLEEEGFPRGNTIFPGWTLDKYTMCNKNFFDWALPSRDMNFSYFRALLPSCFFFPLWKILDWFLQYPVKILIPCETKNSIPSALWKFWIPCEHF